MRLPVPSFPSMVAVVWASVMVDGRCDPVRDAEVPVPVAEDAAPEQKSGDFGFEAFGGGPEAYDRTFEGLESCGEARPSDEGPSRPRGTVVPVAGPMALTGGDEARAVATGKKYAGQLMYCYEKALKDTPDLAGTVDVTWRWENGLVPVLPVARADTPESEGVSDCVVKKIRRWEADPDTQGEVSWTFRFEQRL